MKLFRTIARYLSIGSHRSSVPTGLLPLGEVRSVTVFTDGADQGLEPAKVRIRKFFGDRSVTFISALDKDIRTSSDVFIALNSKPSVDERYAASSSTARFKLGRHQLKGQIYDFVVTDPAEEPSTAGAAFDVMANLITHIK